MRLPGKYVWPCGWILWAFCAGMAGGGEVHEIEILLARELDHPGFIRLRADGKTLDALCILGVAAKGNLNREFLHTLAGADFSQEPLVPAPPLPEERWPVTDFIQDGALRLRPATGARFLQHRHGLVIHGRDFFPLLMPVLQDKKMIRFYDRQLFQRLGRYWGPLRVSNWDMGRLLDFWKRHTRNPNQWRARLAAVDPAAIHKRCRPPQGQTNPVTGSSGGT